MRLVITAGMSRWRSGRCPGRGSARVRGREGGSAAGAGRVVRGERAPGASLSVADGVGCEGPAVGKVAVGSHVRYEFVRGPTRCSERTPGPSCPVGRGLRDECRRTPRLWRPAGGVPMRGGGRIRPRALSGLMFRHDVTDTRRRWCRFAEVARVTNSAEGGGVVATTRLRVGARPWAMRGWVTVGGARATPSRSPRHRPRSH